MNDRIFIKGAREHNLKNVDVELPRNKLVVLTGLSGSGKSSLAFDTLYAEGQRRYVESLSSYARQFLGQMEKPDVDYIEGLSPAISIDQKTTSKNPRSTVGTVTEIHDYLRLLYARIGVPHCPVCGKEMAAGVKACPSCGAKNKKPIYRRWWFWVLVVLVIAAVGSAMGSEDNGTEAPQQIQQETTGTPESGAGQAEEPAVTYTAYSVGQLMDDLDSNALKAESTYQDQYVELTGRLNVIDSDGDYISIVPQDDQFAILGVQCYLLTEEQRQQVLDMQIDQVITVRGQITSVGEVMGYSLDVDDFGA